MDLSPSMSREGNLEGHQSLDHFDTSSPLMFRQIELFNILVSDKMMIHRELRNKRKLTREF